MRRFINEDSDVSKERRLIREKEAESFPVIINSISKVFTNKLGKTFRTRLKRVILQSTLKVFRIEHSVLSRSRTRNRVKTPKNCINNKHTLEAKLSPL